MVARIENQGEIVIKVLMIEDDRNIVEIISLAFQMRLPDATLVYANLGKQGLKLMEIEAPDIVIVDLGLPDISGFEVIEQIRRSSSVPILVLSVRGEESDIVEGVELGADDYVVKPFKQVELLARVEALTRTAPYQEKEASLQIGPLHFKPSSRELVCQGRRVAITATEADILYLLMKNAGHAVSNSSLAAVIWGADYPGSANSLRFHINRLRSQLEADPDSPRLILTEPGVGYMMVA